MKTLLSILLVLATSNIALSANIPFGYSCTTDLLGICDHDRDAPPEPEPAPEPTPPSDEGDDDDEGSDTPQAVD